MSLIRAHWDTTDPSNHGWYAARWEHDQITDDSQKIYWPCDLDGYDRGDVEGVRRALELAFPGCVVEVVVEGGRCPDAQRFM